MFTSMWGAADGATLRKRFDGRLDIRAPEDTFANDEHVSDRLRRPIEQPHIEEAVNELLRAWREGDRDRATTAADQDAGRLVQLQSSVKPTNEFCDANEAAWCRAVADYERLRNEIYDVHVEQRKAYEERMVRQREWLAKRGRVSQSEEERLLAAVQQKLQVEMDLLQKEQRLRKQLLPLEKEKHAIRMRHKGCEKPLPVDPSPLIS